jgi:hypothetical protein
MRPPRSSGFTNKSGWWIVPYLVVPGLYGQFDAWLGGSWLAVFIGYATFVALVGGLAEMCFVRGTRGPNRFGPDPLARLESAARWDQMGEIELVPHSAGPSASA